MKMASWDHLHWYAKKKITYSLFLFSFIQKARKTTLLFSVLYVCFLQTYPWFGSISFSLVSLVTCILRKKCTLHCWKIRGLKRSLGTTQGQLGAFLVLFSGNGRRKNYQKLFYLCFSIRKIPPNWNKLDQLLIKKDLLPLTRSSSWLG